MNVNFEEIDNTIVSKLPHLRNFDWIAAVKEPKNNNIRKILCLHGGGDSVNGFSNQRGIIDIQSSLSDDYVFDFLSASDDGRSDTWWDDPPSKNQPSQDENWAQETINKINQKINDDGPYYALLGYSQGASAVIVWNAFNGESDNPSDIKKLLLFCGYLPETHTGLMKVINKNAPSSTRTLIFIGTQDYNFYQLGLDIKNKFNNYTELIDTNVGHYLPTNTDETFDNVLNFITKM